jgi:sigma54-dependent transcription regulator
VLRERAVIQDKRFANFAFQSDFDEDMILILGLDSEPLTTKVARGHFRLDILKRTLWISREGMWK